MAPRTACGLVSFSIDVDDASLSSATNQEAIESVVVELVDRFSKRGITATWALSEPENTTLRFRLGRGAVPHEIALAADSALSSRSSSRTDFTQGVVRRIQRAANSGVAISSLTTRETWQPRHLDLLTKHGLTMVRSRRPLAGGLRIISRRGGAGVQTVCYGLWHMPVAATLRGGGWMSNLSQLRVVRKAIDRAAATSGVCHLRIDAVAMSQGDGAIGLRTVDRLLQYVDRLRSTGTIAVQTLRETAMALTPRRSTAPAHSILRVA